MDIDVQEYIAMKYWVVWNGIQMGHIAVEVRIFYFKGGGYLL